MIRNTDLVAFVAEKHDIKENDASAFVDAAFSLILDGLQLGEIVKVKGLGTFKVMQTKERESVDVNTGERILLGSKSKVIFTPDMVLRERVNAPFAGFSSVLLSDGVEVEIEQNTIANSENQPSDEPSTATDATHSSQEKQTLEVQNPKKEEENKSDASNTAMVKNAAAPSEKTEPNCEDTPKAEALITTEEVKEDNISEPSELEEDRSDTSQLRLWIWILAVLLAIAIGACGFLLWKMNTLKSEVTANDKENAQIEMVDTVTNQPAAKPLEDANKSQIEPSVDTTKTTSAKDLSKEVEPTDNQSATMQHPLRSTDPRVKLGAYYIVGTQCEVTVQKGQTFAGISRAYLGEDMECYMEAYNHTTAVKVGDKLLVPKLITKKAWKKKMGK